jgi:carbon-monoxide dehydrogenase large subunit
LGEFGIGQPVPRLEDPRLLRGEGEFVDDTRYPNEAYAHVLRSPRPHARIIKIDAAAARECPGVLAVLTGEDAVADGLGTIPNIVPRNHRNGSPMFVPPHTVLAVGRVRYVGECVVLVVAETAEVAAEAADLITVDYEDLPFVTDTAAAARPAAPAIWEEVPDNNAFFFELGDKAATDAAFERAAHVVETDFVISRITANPMEPRAAIGQYSARDGRWTLYANVQHPHTVRGIICGSLLRVPEHRLRIIATDVGGSFGMKGMVHPELVQVLWAAQKLGRPVRWISTRSEGLLGDAQARDNVSTARLALDADGRFLGLHVSTIVNLGAYLSIYGPHCGTNNLGGLAGVYKTPNIYTDVTGIYSNTMNTGPYRGAGRPEAGFAIERVIDVAARELGLDRVKLRRRNMIPTESLPYQTPLTFNYDSGEFEKNMTRVLKFANHANFEERRAATRSQGRLRGFGLANCVEMAGPGGVDETMEIRLHPDGTATVQVGTDAQGQGHETMYSQYVNEFLGLPLESIRIIASDTDIVARARGTFGSRSSCVGGAALKETADIIIEKGRRIAAHVLEAATDDIEFEDGMFRVAGTDREIGISDVARTAYRIGALPAGMEPGLGALKTHIPPASTYPNGCHVCEVEIDPDTGMVDVKSYHVVDDVGRAINPPLVQGQVHGGVSQGMGQVVWEQIVYDEESGQPLTGSFMDYCMPRADDVPNMDIEHNNVPTTANPMGVKGAGEAGAVGALPAVFSAVADALSERGIVHFDMPATPERVWRALQDAKATG